MAQNTIKVLVVNTGGNPVTTERHEFKDTDKTKIDSTILDSINRLGKLAHALVKDGSKYFIYDHTAHKGPSKELFKHQVHYHPYMKELA